MFLRALIYFSSLALLFRLIWSTYFFRKLHLHSSCTKREFLGKPFLFPAKLSHARRFPVTERYNYWYDYFMIGIPVGLRGRVGNLLSIDNIPSKERWWQKCWFTIDAAYYLDPGSGERSLEEKLHVFLRSVDQNPKDYPYAYLLSVPRFLWWQKSAINYWYLYSPSRELTAMIMEINNSFYEKRNFFFSLAPAGSQKEDICEVSQTVPARSQNGLTQPEELVFRTSLSKCTNYKGSWEKSIFGSPFEKVGGSMPAKFSDMLSEVPPRLQSTLSSVSPEGQIKVTSRLSSWGDAVDALDSSSWTIMKFVMRWTHVGALSAPRIVKEALRVRFRGGLKYLQRPEVRKGSIARKETPVERSLELVFCEYLSQLIKHCNIPLTLKYTPPKTISFEPITFHSPVPPTSHPRPSLEICPITPRFYTSITQYRTAKQGFLAECMPCITEADDTSSRLYVSDWTLLTDLLDRATPALDDTLSLKSSTPGFQSRWKCAAANHLIPWLRRSSASETTFMARFVSVNCAPDTYWKYRKCVFHHLLSLMLPIESQAVVQLCFIMVRMVLVGVGLEMAVRIDGVRAWLEYLSIGPVSGSVVYAGWDLLETYLGEYYLNPFGWGEGL
ncbi:uncharacterized protein BO80DRAFT_488490 [Aspergillus ibericus CBS 121593]|uniref:Uncharacterized protein n=1 Tax=Aspergillus ibericus CBS 121593 TaxID=1448316 RepID=A0A395H7L2_9EURO|nr:hypothetical protein BO80DRAFT_488490 [Aspergillus ibericus CBS 121593]RAL03493.1 hypothetical protein BO80DRAFT_488490 [Aspergillus ibericus CBS 121593]